MKKRLAELNWRHRAFCIDYLESFDHRQAGLNQGFSPIRGRQFLADPLIQNELARLMRRREERVSVNKERIIREYAKIAFSNIGAFMKIVGGQVVVRDFDEMDEADTSCISEISEAKDGTVKLKLHDKKGALDSLAKHMGMFHEFEGKDKSRPLVNIVIGGESGEEVIRNVNKQLTEGEGNDEQTITIK